MSELNVYHHELRPDEYDEFYLKYEADAAIAELEARNHELEEERRWRKCSDEMPSNGQEVLVWLTAGGSHGFVLTSTYLDSQWYYGEDPQGCKPSHWMPMPSDPKEEK